MACREGYHDKERRHCITCSALCLLALDVVLHKQEAVVSKQVWEVVCVVVGPMLHSLAVHADLVVVVAAVSLEPNPLVPARRDVLQPACSREAVLQRGWGAVCDSLAVLNDDCNYAPGSSTCP